MKLRRRVLIVAGLALSLPQFSRAQARMPRIGWLMFGDTSARGQPAGDRSSSRYEAFRLGLRELGYREGRNLIIEHRSAERQIARLPALAAELVQLKIAVLVALEPPAVEAAMQATRTIPIVMRSSDDPAELGWVASLARPGGNVTGVTSYSMLLHGKRMQLLQETIPGLTYIAVLWDPQGLAGTPSFRRIQAAAQELRVRVHSLPVRSPKEIENAFDSALKAGAGAVLALRGPLIVSERGRVAETAARARIPVIYDDREFAEAGGLMSYGTNLAESYRRAAVYVDRILKGAGPSDLPVEQPTTFELVINLKTARALGLTIPQSVL
ncbi:MAG: ABC transporter substrate-binding protein, partial [Burkholderiales bacterium]